MSRIDDLLWEARKYKDLSDRYRMLANHRRAAILAEFRQYYAWGARDNPMFAALLRDERAFRFTVSAVVTQDPVWLDHVDDQKFYERLANQAANQANMEILNELLMRKQEMSQWTQ